MVGNYAHASGKLDRTYNLQGDAGSLALTARYGGLIFYSAKSPWWDCSFLATSEQRYSTREVRRYRFKPWTTGLQCKQNRSGRYGWAWCRLWCRRPVDQWMSWSSGGPCYWPRSGVCQSMKSVNHVSLNRISANFRTVLVAIWCLMKRMISEGRWRLIGTKLLPPKLGGIVLWAQGWSSRHGECAVEEYLMGVIVLCMRVDRSKLIPKSACL